MEVNSDMASPSDSLEHPEFERLCNFGAAEILMPGSFVRDGLSQWGLSAAGLQRLYDCFLVNFKTLLYRLAETVPASAAILWRKYARHEGESCDLRVLTAYQRYSHDSQSPWLPKGATARKHVHPDVVTAALDRDTPIFSSDLKLVLNEREERCIGIATSMPKPRKADSQLPLFEGRRILDDVPSDIQVLLFVGKQSMHFDTGFWKSLEEQSLC